MHLLKYVEGPWEAVRGFIKSDLEVIQEAFNSRWNAVFGSNDTLLSDAIDGDATEATRYIANTGTKNAPKWDQVNLSNGVKSRLDWSRLAQADPATLLGRRDGGSGGDVESVEIGDGLEITSDPELRNLLVDVPLLTYDDQSALIPTSRQLIAGSGVTLDDSVDNELTINVTGAAAAPVGASYVTLATDGTLTNERVLTAGTGITLTDGGPGSTVTIAASGGGGDLVLLEQHTASASASLDFTSCITSTYDEYEFHLINVVMGTNGTRPVMRMSTNGGSSYDSGSNYIWDAFEWRNGAYGVSGGSGVTFIAVTGNDTSNTASYGGVCGKITLYSPLDTTMYKRVSGKTTGPFWSGDLPLQWEQSGRYTSTSAVNAVRFLANSGNLASGTIRVYGVAK